MAIVPESSAGQTLDFSFIAGTVCGIYIAQNYKIPNVKKVVYETLFTAKQVEEKYRKPKKPSDDDA